MSDYFENEKRERQRQPHPVWRGIGFIMAIIIPFFSFAAADVVMNLAKGSGVVLPSELRSAPIDIPLYGQVVDYKAVLIVAFIIMLSLFALLGVVNAAMYRSSSERTYQVFESEPKQFKKKKKLYKPKYDR